MYRRTRGAIAGTISLHPSRTAIHQIAREVRDMLSELPERDDDSVDSRASGAPQDGHPIPPWDRIASQLSEGGTGRQRPQHPASITITGANGDPASDATVSWSATRFNESGWTGEASTRRNEREREKKEKKGALGCMPDLGPTFSSCPRASTHIGAALTDDYDDPSLVLEALGIFTSPFVAFLLGLGR
ncbi:uncharacterized protein N7459_008377 [Penicillium hispanicum]|uniref:uncharacterized protein n=1 Tax=Penicillium hispanicum TaxID=1080232 RepID=UPI00253F83C6|nr:uncharacterized protein N7459_008377 [Penicillium hispanicum]KAJ5573950.1 hypothetical protein N7459_008377 [Penicillium hispanicum]